MRGASGGKALLVVKIIFGVLVFIALTFAAFWLAGAFVLIGWRQNPMNATLGTFLQYWGVYHETAQYVKRLKVSVALSLVVCYGFPVIAVLTAGRKQRALHGEARFANDAEVRKSGLLASKGIIVGKWRDKYLVFGGSQFVILSAPTRSGKGVGVVIPNLLNWSESVVVQDIKLENYNLTAGFREKHGQKCYLFNPFAEDKRTTRYNPLEYVRDAEFRVGDLIAIGESFFSSGGGGKGEDAFFNDQARNLFVGLGLYLCETPELPRTIGEMLRQSSGKGMPLKTYLEGIINARNYIVDEEGNRQGERPWKEGDPGLPPLSSECVDSLNRFLSITGNTASSVIASFNSPLGIWQNPIVDAATSANDFDLRNVRKERMSIYLGITPDHLNEAGRLLNLFWSQLVNLNTKELPQDNPELKYQCLLLEDEFTAPGRISIIAKSVAYMAGYGLRLLTIIQSQAQLEGVYGKEDARTLVTNHALQILYAPREQRDANEYSEILGYETVKGMSTSRSIGGRSGGGRNESTSDQRRALMLPQELKELGLWKEIVILENCKPILCDKVKYFEDPVFTARLLPTPEIPLLDMELHKAIRENRIRAANEDDIAENGAIDLGKVALNLSCCEFPEGSDEVSPAELQSMIGSLFGALEAGGEGYYETEEQEDETASNIVSILEQAEDSADFEVFGNSVEQIDEGDGDGDAWSDYAPADDAPDEDNEKIDLADFDASQAFAEDDANIVDLSSTNSNN
jgi:type IV secretion system protein VirD4